MNILFDTLNQWASTKPNHIALVGTDEQGQSVQFTYAEMLEEIEQTAEALKALDIEALALRAEKQRELGNYRFGRNGSEYRRCPYSYFLF
ncbi:hypothetical protein NI382_07890 [Vibrio parahaemolyticus]|nr:hypothetical protein NI382_07890 [Vibrio parahaemolyticus]